MWSWWLVSLSENTYIEDEDEEVASDGEKEEGELKDF